ncbi:hypothetical protein BC835DRAFT_1287652 [Cytidiella melzeri]|nr:hypothetical protein BC835DRAFT_1287652 [Cytidiella melzeri]
MVCTGCNATGPCSTLYRCKECWRHPPLCKKCVVTTHTGNPLHIVEEWTHERGFWKRQTLAELGMVIHLGDHGGDTCYSTVSGTREICVVNLHGIQQAYVRFCGCRMASQAPQHDHIQLLEVGLWPATWKTPRTAFSIEVLDDFRRASTQGNITAQDYMMARVRQTDGVLPKAAKDRYREFLVATRKYQFLKMCMRKGVQPSGSLVYGSLANMCPACPHIAINICQEWSTRTEDKQYLDALYHAVDGNFTQNMKDKGSDEHDLPLTLGSAYFANEHDAKQYFAAMPPPKTEASNCNKFGAMGYYGHWGSVSGLVGLSCARHMFVLPGGGVDLKVGETWAAVDFLMLSGLQNWMRLKLHISAYDINCQYRLHFYERLAAIQAKFFDEQKSSLKSVHQFSFPATRAAVGKFHEPAHKLECRLEYSFHYLPGAGQTDGEAPERIWAATTFLGLRTREMSPGHRHDTINFFHDDMNWRKTYGIAAHLTKKFCEAKRYQSESSAYLAELESEIMGSGLPADILEVWETTKRNWDQHLIDVGKPTESVPPSRRASTTLLCPYEALKSNGKKFKLRSVCLSVTLQLSLMTLHCRACLILQLSRKSSGWTDEKIAEIQEGFSKRVGVWSKAADSSLQTFVAVAMDSLSQERRVAVYKEVRTKNASLAEGTKRSRACVEDLLAVEICLPSSYPRDVQRHESVVEAAKLEKDLRQAHADDALDEVRAHPASSYGMYLHLKKAVTQKMKTRSSGPAQRIRSAVYAAADVYRRARVAMVSLGMNDADSTYRPLKKQDLKAFVVREEDRRLGDSKNLKQSWIWGDLTFVNNDLSEGVKTHIIGHLRVHWCRTKARAERWEEEMELVKTEMTRTIRFFAFYAHLWERRADESSDGGSASYARK